MLTKCSYRSAFFACTATAVLLAAVGLLMPETAAARNQYCSFQSPADQRPGQRLVNTRRSLRLYPQPDTVCFTFLTWLSLNESVQVLADQDDWLFVRTLDQNPRRGWIPAESLRPGCPADFSAGALKPDWLLPACRWTRAFSQDTGWTGADATYSVQLQDGRQLFLFGDTFFGNVIDGRRTWPPVGNWFLRNSAALTDDNSPESLRFLTGGSPEIPQTLFIPPDNRGWFWPGEALTTEAQTGIVLTQYENSADPLFLYGRQTGVWMADISIGNTLQINQYRPLFSDTPDLVVGGAAVMEEAPYFYIYSNAQRVEENRLISQLKISRVHQNSDITDFSQWEHFNGIYGWSSSYAQAGSVPAVIANEFSVQRLKKNVYLMVVQFAGQIGFNVAPSPVGPWTWVPLTTPPEANQPGLFSYNAKAHPELSDGRGLLISYNLNSTDPVRSYTDAAIYRPRFFRAPWWIVDIIADSALERTQR